MRLSRSDRADKLIRKANIPFVSKWLLIYLTWPKSSRAVHSGALGDGWS